jgi:hypothetical protein
MRNINKDCGTINDLVRCYEQDARFVDEAPPDALRKVESRINEYKRILDYWDGRCTEIENGRGFVESLEGKLKKAVSRQNKKPSVIKPKIRKFANACAGFFLGGVLFVGCTNLYDAFRGQKNQYQANPVESAINTYLEQIDKNPADYRIHLELSKFYEKNGMTAEAEKEHAVALKIIKNNHP